MTTFFSEPIQIFC